jgi:Helix-turn-helix.
MAKLGTSIREHRKKTKLKVYQLAKKVGVSPEFITEVELGYKYPSAKVLEKICKVLVYDFRPTYMKERHPDLVLLLKDKVIAVEFKHYSK